MKSAAILLVLLLSLLSTAAFADYTAKDYVDGARDFADEFDYTDAIRACNKAIALDPNYGDAYYERGYVHLEEKKYGKAVSDETKAIKLNPDQAILAGAHEFRASCYVKLGKYSRAINDANKALELDPNNNFYAYEARGEGYGGLGNYDQELADENTSLSYYASNWEALVARARAYHALGQDQNAWADVRAVQALNKTVPDDLFNALRGN